MHEFTLRREHSSLLRFQESCQTAQKERLARSVWPKDEGDLAFRDGALQIGEQGMLLVLEREALDCKCCIHRLCIFRRW
jgi:hypothetical protein